MAVRDGDAEEWDVSMSHDPPTCRSVLREPLHHTDRLGGGVLWESGHDR
jgi:hypothetical protein